jgi:tight adherence protein C
MTAVLLSISLAGGIILVFSRFAANGRRSLIGRLSARSRQASPFAIELKQLKAKGAQAFTSKSRLRSALEELPDILEMLAVALSAGDGIFSSLARVTPRASGVLATELKRLFIALELGGDLETELADLARRLPQRQVVEFTGKLATALRRGAPLAQMLREQAESARSEVRNEFLMQVGRNETRMLIPLIFLILPVTVLFAIYPSLQFLNVDYL